MKNHKLSKILKLANDLTKQELIMLNQAVVSLIKMQQDVDFKKSICPTFEEANQIMEEEIKKASFH